MSEPYIGQIMLVPYNFPPNGWQFCNGQLLSIAQNTALFSLLGTTFGGDGQSTFGLPDFRGRLPLSAGQGPGLSPYDLGEVAGQETVTLISTQMPTHNHTATLGDLAVKKRGKNGPGDSRTPVACVPAIEGVGVTATYSALASDADMAIGVNGALAVSGTPALANTGSNSPHTNIQPYLVLNYCIATEGIYPSRN